MSKAELVGGGSPPRPGEVSLAHNGVLFLDEFAEFRRGALEALHQPLEDGEVLIARSKTRARFPARPLVLAAMNPCPCGFRGHPRETYRCSVGLVAKYRQKLSGPLLDRLDVHVPLPPVEIRTLTRVLSASRALKTVGSTMRPLDTGFNAKHPFVVPQVLDG